MIHSIAMPIGIAAALVISSISFASGQPLPQAGPESVGLSSERLDRIDAVMQELVDSSRTAGVAILVLRDGRAVKSGAYGWADREARRPLQMDALFRIASQTKAVTSVAAMILVEEGRLRLSDPVRLWVPSFENMTVAGENGPDSARRPITIRDLLTHTAGISYGNEPAVRQAFEAAGLGPAAGAGWYFADKEEPICATMDRLGTLPLVAHPGERFVYGYSTDLLGCVVERVSGQPLDELFRERIFRPLGMMNTFFFVPDSERSRLAVVYAAGPEVLKRAPEGAIGQGAYVDGPRESFSGGAGLVSSIEDYARFLQMLMNGGELDGARILSQHSVSLMTGDHLGSIYNRPGLGFGLGFQVLQNPALAGLYGASGAYGWGGAYATSYWVDPAERLVALIMTQTLPSGGLDAADRFRALVYSALLKPGPPEDR